jgi:glycosyltransferase involved in cell wall biosynthesis
MRISIVIPLLNEAESLTQLYQEIVQHTQGHDLEIIFIDDGSTDVSFEILKSVAELDKRVRVIRFRRNFSKAAALQIGFSKARGT